jgi:chromate reductase
MTNVAVIVGSLRKASFSRMLARAMMDLAPANMKCEIIEIGDLSWYNQDDDTDHPPARWVAFRDRIRPMNAVLFVTPEYNRTIPGALKNAIDVGSRPYGKSVWSGKPAGVVSSSPGGIGGFGANHQLRQALVFLDMPCLQQPEAYIGHVNTLFDEQGKLTNDGTRDFLRKYMETFATWIERTGR